MENLGHSGSFLGFTYNGIHSSTLGITRVSNNRYTETLAPITKDVTTTIDGADSTQYWGSTHTKRDITVPFAFEGLSEIQLENLRQFSNGKEIHDLIFDEAPDRIYAAKITGTAIMKHIPFGEEETYYNGEGSLTFTCYCPYAHSPLISLTPNNNNIVINNKGDVPISLKFWYYIYSATTAEPFNVNIVFNTHSLVISQLVRKTETSHTGAGADAWCVIDSESASADGYDNYPNNPDTSIRGSNPRQTGRTYNDCLTGAYFVIPPGTSTIYCSSLPSRIEYYYFYL